MRLTRSWESRSINTSVSRECSWVFSAGRHWKRPEGGIHCGGRRGRSKPIRRTRFLLAVSLEVFGHEVTYAFGSVAPVREHLGVVGGVGLLDPPAALHRPLPLTTSVKEKNCDESTPQQPLRLWGVWAFISFPPPLLRETL